MAAAAAAGTAGAASVLTWFQRGSMSTCALPSVFCFVMKLRSSVALPAFSTTALGAHTATLKDLPAAAHIWQQQQQR